MARNNVSKTAYNKAYKNYLKRYSTAVKKYGAENIPKKIERKKAEKVSYKELALLESQRETYFKSLQTKPTKPVKSVTRIKETERMMNWLDDYIPSIFKFEKTKQLYKQALSELLSNYDIDHIIGVINELGSRLIEDAYTIKTYETGVDTATNNDKVKEWTKTFFSKFGMSIDVSEETDDYMMEDTTEEDEESEGREYT